MSVPANANKTVDGFLKRNDDTNFEGDLAVNGPVDTVGTVYLLNVGLSTGLRSG